MPRMYVLSNELTAFVAANTVVEVGAAANKVIKIHRIKIGQSTTEVDDSTKVEWGTYTATGTGTPVTALAVPTDPGDSAYGGVAKDNHTVDISTGEVILGREGISLLAGFEKIFLPEARPVIPGAGFFGMHIRVAILSVTIVYEVTFEEIG